MSTSSGPNRTRAVGNATLLASALATVFLLPSMVCAEAEANGGQPASGVYYPIKARPLAEVLKDIATRSGISFRLADSLKREKITATLIGKDWSEASKSLLKGYNYAIEVSKSGSWESVTVSGKNGDGKLTASLGSQFQRYSRSSLKDLPARLQGLNPGSVTPITLPMSTLKGMRLGQSVSLDLPSGQNSFVNDNRFNHSNGDITWVGYPADDGQPYRAMITMGRGGAMGYITTPEGNYQIITEDGQTYLLDINASGLQPGSLLDDQAGVNASPADSPGADLVLLGSGGGVSNKAALAASEMPAGSPSPTNTATSGSGANAGNISTIDVLVLYTKGLSQPETRVNYLAALTNQAYLDSKINAKIRVVKLEAVDYGSAGDNSQALSDLTNGASPFDKVQALREKNGADLVTLIRPFHASSQKSCGIAWVNGSNGSALSPSLGFSVVSDGADQDGQPVYCGDHTLAHELGHNLANVHDRPFTNNAGAFPYSYAWGVEGSFGTIMSYRQPTVLVFATPLLPVSCYGQPCGYPEGSPNASDNTATINQTAPVVAGFRPTAIPSKQ